MNSRDYWLQREAEQLKHNITEEAEYNKRIEQIYRDMLDACQKEIDSFYGRYANAEGISIVEAKKRVSQLDIAAYERKAKRYVRDKDFSAKANEEMRLYNATMKINRLEMLKANIGLELISGHNELEKFMESILKGRTKAELRRQAGILGKTVRNNAQKAHAIVNGSFHNGTFSDRIWQYQDLMREELGRILQTGLIQGKNPRALTKDLQKYWYGNDPRTGGGAKYCMERLMRTELARVQTEAQKQSFIRNGFKQYTFIVNGGCCPLCEETAKKNDGHYNVEDMMPGTNAPPMHPNCRCSTAAYEDSKDYEAWLDHLANGGTTEEWEKLKEQPKKTAAMKRDPAKFRNVEPQSITTLSDRLSSCKTTDEVSATTQDYFHQKGSKIRIVDFGKADTDAAKQMAEMLDRLDDKYKSSLTNFKVRWMPDSQGGKATPTHASFMRFMQTGNPFDLESEITLNETFLKTKKAIKHDFGRHHRTMYGGGVASGPVVDEKYAAVSSLVHEFGHTICPGKANEIYQDTTGNINSYFMPFRRLYNVYMRELRNKQREIQAIQDSFAGQPDGLRLGLEAAKDLQAEYDAMCISRYSKESVGEFIAEAFCDALLSSNPKPASLKVLETIEKLYEKEK